MIKSNIFSFLFFLGIGALCIFLDVENSVEGPVVITFFLRAIGIMCFICAGFLLGIENQSGQLIEMNNLKEGKVYHVVSVLSEGSETITVIEMLSKDGKPVDESKRRTEKLPENVNKVGVLFSITGGNFNLIGTKNTPA